MATNPNIPILSDTEITEKVRLLVGEYYAAEMEQRGEIYNHIHSIGWHNIVGACEHTKNTMVLHFIYRMILDERKRLPSRITELEDEIRRIDEAITRCQFEIKPEAGGSKVAALTNPKIPRGADGVRLPRMMDIIDRHGGLSQPLPQVVTKLMEEHFPSVFQLFYPRRYENVGAFHSPKHCCAYLSNMVVEAARIGFDKSPTAYRLAMPSMAYLLERRMPMFFISPDLLTAIKATDFADDIDWVNLKLPFEHGLFVLPRGGITHPSDGDVSMILWSRATPGNYPPPIPGIPTISIPDTAFVMVSLCPDKGMWYDSTLNAKYRPTLRLRNLFYRSPGDQIPKSEKNMPMLDEDLTEEDAGFIEDLGVILFGTLMAMNARPELVEPAKLLRKVGKGSEERREFWSPNIIGRKYKIKREVPRIVSGQFQHGQREHGSHASPRAHFRRGHWRQQPFGPGRRERKTIWIEPIFVTGVGDWNENSGRTT